MGVFLDWTAKMKLAKNKKWIFNYIFNFLKISDVLLSVCMTFCYHQTLKGLPSPVAMGLCFWFKKGHNLAIIVSVNFVLATKEFSSLGFLSLVPSTVFYLKINVWTIILYLKMIQLLGTRLSTQEPKKLHGRVHFDFFNHQMLEIEEVMLDCWTW